MPEVYRETALILQVTLLLTAAGCGGGAPTAVPTERTDAGTRRRGDAEIAGGGVPVSPRPRVPASVLSPYDAALATGCISGLIALSGEAPRPERVDFGPNVDCEKHRTEPLYKEDIVAKDGHLANVVVFVKTGWQKWSFDPPAAPVKLDQQGCQYRPHVLALRAGQPLEISNSDPFIHNIHARPVENDEFNLSQSEAGMKTTRRFPVAELGIRIGCDVHKWMSAFACVFEHPFFAVSDSGGRFILHLPPGEYELATWHESVLDGARAKLAAPPPVKISVTEKPVAQDFVYTVVKAQ
jgi:hypothetical protein